MVDYPPIRIDISKIVNRITFKIKTESYLELLATKKIKLFGSTKSKLTKNKNVENVPGLEITEVVLFHCNIVDNNYQESCIYIYIFVSKKSFSQLLDVSLKKFIFLTLIWEGRGEGG